MKKFKKISLLICILLIFTVLLPCVMASEIKTGCFDGINYNYVYNPKTNENIVLYEPDADDLDSVEHFSDEGEQVEVRSSSSDYTFHIKKQPSEKTRSFTSNSSNGADIEIRNLDDEIIIDSSDKEITANMQCEVSLPSGGYFEFSKDSDGNNLPAIILRDANGVAIGGFYDSKGITKEGETIDIDLTIDNNSVVQTIPDEIVNDLGNVTLKVASLDYAHFYESSYWITRGGDYPLSLSINTNPTGQWDSFTNVAWDVLANRHRNDRAILQGVPRGPLLWSNEQSIYNQWFCHWSTVGHFKTWNLEPKRPNVGLAQTIASGCNP